MECLVVSSIRHMIGLQWNLKVKDILPDSSTQDCENPFRVNGNTICSCLCRIKGMENSIFSLGLTSELNIHVKGHNRWSYELIYAFAVVKDRAFLVKKTDQLKFLDILRPNHLHLEEEVTFHCMVSVDAHAPDSIKAESDLADLSEELSVEGKGYIDLEDIVLSHKKFDGKIPEFTSSKARDLIMNGGTNSVLRVLAVEYLIKCINSKNIYDTLKTAIDHNLQALKKECGNFLSHRKIQDKDSLSSARKSTDSPCSGDAAVPSETD